MAAGAWCPLWWGAIRTAGRGGLDVVEATKRRSRGKRCDYGQDSGKRGKLLRALDMLERVGPAKWLGPRSEPDDAKMLKS